ncbi:MAG TPA: crotonase/enoyl-CoA hydratase family protein [Gammaproteobacteria bacterium]|nr:crotonase/enoyl-CoA hydratase family protein [Gammaproteobacteria bacterium]
MPPDVPACESLEVELDDKVVFIRINRPDKANAMDAAFWREIRMLMEWVDRTPEARVAVISGNGRHFTAGIDLNLLSEVGLPAGDGCEGRRREALRLNILEMQKSFTAIEACRKPVLAAVHSACVGGGIDLISACDMRYASADAYFCVKEIDVGMTADVGTLQRLPRIIPDGVARELAYTGRNMDAEEARRVGLVNRTWPDRDGLMRGVTGIARAIAAKTPLGIRGTKEMILYTRDHSIEDGLNYIATWNAAMIISEDIREALAARAEKREPRFRD